MAKWESDDYYVSIAKSVECMEDFRHATEQLRDAAFREPSDFAKALQKFLVTDFAATLLYVKTQKLVSKCRSSSWISRLEREMSSWLAHAPLKGKQKAQLSRHFAVCHAIQELLEIVDEQSSALRIWQASTRDLLRTLFASVEELWLAQENENEHDFQPRDQLAALKGAHLVHMQLRIHCDYVTRIVNQASGAGLRHTGVTELSHSDIRDALRGAALDDLILHVLDCYTYKNFRVSVKGKHLEMNGVDSQLEQALTWSSLRTHSREALDGYNIAKTIKGLHALTGALTSESKSFSQFLDSSAGAQLLQAQPGGASKITTVDNVFCIYKLPQVLAQFINLFLEPRPVVRIDRIPVSIPLSNRRINEFRDGEMAFERNEEAQSVSNQPTPSPFVCLPHCQSVRRVELDRAIEARSCRECAFVWQLLNERIADIVWIALA